MPLSTLEWVEGAFALKVCWGEISSKTDSVLEEALPPPPGGCHHLSHPGPPPGCKSRGQASPELGKH